MGTKIKCKECNGTGEIIWSCCGDNLNGSDILICPTCGEHCGDESEECEFCDIANEKQK